MKKLEESKRTGENEGGGEQDERVRRKRGKDRERERRDSQSMKLFDNLVIYFLQSIPPEELAIKGDTQ